MLLPNRSGQGVGVSKDFDDALPRWQPQSLLASISVAGKMALNQKVQEGAMRIETVAAHAAQKVDPASGAVTTPIHLSTTHERDPDGEFSRGFIYSRSGNPTRQALEECLSQLEGGAAAAAFSSGSAATTAVFQALASGDHVIAPNDCYHGTARVLRDVFSHWGLEATFADMADLEQVKEAVRSNTRLIWVETPSNPLLKITDVGQIAEIAHDARALCACDNTWATPMLQRPLELGADLVIHSTTKYLGGHSDVLGGAAISKEDSDFCRRVRLIQSTCGAVPSPFDCWLVLRGIRTLHLRMPVHSQNAMKIATFLSDHPKVDAVYYPGLPDHPGYDIAERQMSNFGGMVSFQVKGGRAEAMQVCARVQVFIRATSLGGTESLIEHRASIEGPDTKTPDNLLRMSVGLENVDDLIEDLAQALG
jgi:cystathionine gamma-synthase